MSELGMHSLPLQPGEIKLEYIPKEWRVIPIGASKGPYIKGWQLSQYTARDLPGLLEDERAKGVGVIGGPVVGENYGLVWMDIDGASVYPVVEKLADAKLEEALKPTVTIKSGRPGRERRLYKVPKASFDIFVNNKYTWHGETVDEKLEILWTKTQGVLMGSHPKTEGYFTPEGLGFEWAADLPTVPQWLLYAIDEENIKRSPKDRTTRMVGPNWAINLTKDLERELAEAEEALWAMHAKDADAVNDYDIWIQVGMMLHSLDESALEIWERWSKEGDSYKPGECLKRWRSFNKGAGGVTIGSLYHRAKELGWAGPSQDDRAMPVDVEVIDRLLAKAEEEDQVPDDILTSIYPPRSRGRTAREVIQDRNNREEDRKRAKRNTSGQKLTEAVATLWKGTVTFSKLHQSYFKWLTTGVWERMDDSDLQTHIVDALKMLEQEHLPQGIRSFDVNEVLKFLHGEVPKLPPAPEECLLFSNGYLNYETMEFVEELSKRHGFINRIPFPYDPKAELGKIPEWLAWTQYEDHLSPADWKETRILQGVLRMCLVGAGAELQRYPEIIGPGATGKTTFANLCCALVGNKNIATTSFERMNNRFEAASWIGKKLLLLPDQDGWGGSCAVLKALTGGDYITAENKNVKTVREFQFEGMVLVTANQPMQSIDKTTGLKRRRLFLNFDRRFPSNENRRSMIKYHERTDTYSGDFADHMPGLITWVLSMTDADMRRYLMNPEQNSPRNREFSEKQSRQINPVERFVHEQLVWDTGKSAYLGSMHAKEKESDRYEFEKVDLYPAFLRHHRESGGDLRKMMSKHNFSAILMSYLLYELDLKDKLKIDEGKLLRPVDERTGSKGQRSDIRFHDIVLRSSNPTRYKAEYPSLDDFARGLLYGE